ncbi:MAG TPA: formate dehydrogenase subunit delta [Rhizomicrobium sp.]
MSTDDKLIYMANQIAKFFAAQGEARAVAGIGDHIRKFWDPGMRGDFLALARADSARLDPLVRKALPLIEG